MTTPARKAEAEGMPFDLRTLLLALRRRWFLVLLFPMLYYLRETSRAAGPGSGA